MRRDIRLLAEIDIGPENNRYMEGCSAFVTLKMLTSGCVTCSSNVTVSLHHKGWQLSFWYKLIFTVQCWSHTNYMYVLMKAQRKMTSTRVIQ